MHFIIGAMKTNMTIPFGVFFQNNKNKLFRNES